MQVAHRVDEAGDDGKHNGDQGERDRRRIAPGDRVWRAHANPFRLSRTRG